MQTRQSVYRSGRENFVYFYSVRKSDRPSVRPPSDSETKTRLPRRDFNRKRRRRLGAVLSIVYFSRPAEARSSDLWTRQSVRPADWPSGINMYADMGGRARGSHKYPPYLWISPDARGRGLPAVSEKRDIYCKRQPDSERLQTQKVICHSA